MRKISHEVTIFCVFDDCLIVVIITEQKNLASVTSEEAMQYIGEQQIRLISYEELAHGEIL